MQPDTTNPNVIITGFNEDEENNRISITTDVINILEEKLRNLQITQLGEGSSRHKNQKLAPSQSIANQIDIRNALKSLENAARRTDVQVSHPDYSKVHELLKLPLSNCQESETEVSNVLCYLKILCEVGPPLPQSQPVEFALSDVFWKQFLEPIFPDILRYLNQQIFHKCLSAFSSPSTTKDNKTSIASISGHGTGFAFHQQLGVLLKGVRIFLIYLKRATSNIADASENGVFKTNMALDAEIRRSVEVFCAFMNPDGNHFFKQSTNFDIGLDIRCNIGVGICYSLYFLHRNKKNVLKTFFKLIFTPTVPEDIMSVQSEVEREVIKLTTFDVNRIALAFAILSTWLDKEYDLDLYYGIGRNILDIQHGVKEAVNLGSARVLEIWANNLANPDVPSQVLHHASALFPSLEFFCFMYMPGHIDAVKNCCRNIITALAQIYGRLDEEKFLAKDGPKQSWVTGLLMRILEKPVHIKWLALGCVCRNTKKALTILELEPKTPEKLLTAERIFKVAASDAYIALMSYHFQTCPAMAVFENTWIEPLFSTQLSLNNESNWPQKRSIISSILNSERLRIDHLQPMIRPLLENVIKRMTTCCENDQHITIKTQENTAEATLLAAETIKMAHELNLTIDMNEDGKQIKSSSEEESATFRGLVPRSVLHQWLWSADAQVRLAGLALLVETKKTSEIVSKEDFESLKLFFKYNLLSQNSAFRQQSVSYFKKLVRRLRDSLGCARRKKDVAVLNSYENFMKWLWLSLTEGEGLFYGANFGRRCQALEYLSELTETFTDFQIYGISETGNIKYLRWLKDSYDNNKNEALEILVRMPMKEFTDPEFCQNIFDEAMDLCKSVKPPDSVTGRYLMTLLMRKSQNMEKYSPFAILESLYFELASMYERIKSTTLIQVSSETPLYGCVRCIRMILQGTKDYKISENHLKYREYVNKLLTLCFTIDDLLFPVLGNAAPEGFIPGLKDSNPEENKQVVRSLSAQMLLVCAWRTMKEMCLLMSDMCSMFVMEGEHGTPSEHYLLSFEQVSRIGDHLLHLLKNLMHRGVFEQVYVGFKQIANRLWRSSSNVLSALPEKWLQDAMDQEHISAKSITRRSAGLPFIFQALLSAESKNEQFLHRWIQRLLVFDESPEMTPIRIHSMNVLRGLFRDASFSSAMMPFVPHGLRMSFRGLKSVDWTERNSGLMLYGAVMRRSFGPKLNLMNAPTFFRKFPQMYDFLLKELDTCIELMERRKREQESLRNKTSTHDQPNHSDIELTCDFTFHLLLLLSSFTPSARMEDTHFKLETFLPKIRTCGQSDDMEVRKLSAKALVPFLTSPEEKRDIIGSILKEITTELTNLSQNNLHGLLCQFLAVASSLPKERTKECTEANLKLITDFLEFMSTPSAEAEFKAPTIFATVMDILAVFYEMKCADPLHTFNRGIALMEKQFVQNFKCNSNSIAGNMMPGLPVSYKKIARIVVRLSAEVLDWKDVLEKVYNYFTDSTIKSRPYMEQFLELCCESHNSYDSSASVFQQLFQNSVTDESLVVVETIIDSYLKLACDEFSRFPGTDFELAYLRFMKILPVMMYEELDGELLNKLISRLVIICDGEADAEEAFRIKEMTTITIKSNAFMVLGKIAFVSEIEPSQEVITKIADLALDWSASGMDDDLREAVAECFPVIPFPNLQKFSALNQAKIWASIFLVAQDDEIYMRQIINIKLEANLRKPCCDRKSLEILTHSYCKHFLQHNPIEGIILFIGLLLREDFEIEAKAADDESEDRLFDKSEMNMYFEHITLAKTIKSELQLFIERTPSFKVNLNTILTENQTKFYLQLSNSATSLSSLDCSIRGLLLGRKSTNENFTKVDQSDVSYFIKFTKQSDNDVVKNMIQDYLDDFVKLLNRS